MVTIGMDHQPISVPSGSTITIPGKTSKLAENKSYIVEMAANSNLPSGIVVS